MDDLNITMEEYISLEEEKAQKRGRMLNWEIAKYGKIWYDEDVHDLRSVETEFPAIVFNDNLTSNETPSCEPMVSSLNNNKIDFRISFDESDDEDYTVVFDKNSFSYKIISTNDLKTDSENDNKKVNMPLFLSPEPPVSCIDDLDFFKEFENEFPAIVYNDALTSKSDFSTKPTICPQHIDEFDLKDETSLSEYDEEEQNILHFNDLFPFNIIYPDGLKSDKGDDDNEIDMIQSSRGNEYTQGSNNQLEGSHDKIKQYSVSINMEGVFTKFSLYNDMAPLPPYEQRHPFLKYQGLEYSDQDIADFGERMRMEHSDSDGVVVFTSQAWSRVFETRGPLFRELILEFLGTLRFGEALLDLDARISSTGDFLGITSSYTSIRDPLLRLWTLAWSMRGLDVGSVNIPYLLARYLRRFAAGRKSGALISGRQFVARLAKHFGLLTKERLQGLTVTAHALHIGPAMQEGDAGGVAEEALVASGGGDEDEEMPRTVPLLPRTQGERIA
ncbi:hypothetical protein Tco_0689251 [Tanacetum coccineum]